MSITLALPRAARLYLLATALVAGSWLLYHLIWPIPRFPLDDPYIALHSAQVLHWGFDPNYPGVSPLYGATSAPFLGLVYLLLFFLTPIRAIEAACWLGILAYVLGLVYLTRAFRLSRFASFAIITLSLISSFLPIHLLNGLETAWAMAAVVWTLALGSTNRPLWAAAVAGVTAAVRPDLLPFTLLVLLALAFMQPHAERVQFILRGAALAFMPLAICSAWYLIQTGHPIPMTGVAKRYYVSSANLPAPQKFALEVTLTSIYLVSCGPLLIGMKRIIRQPLAIAVLTSIGFLLFAMYVQFPNGVATNHFRYLVVLTPMFIWSIAVEAREGRAKRLLMLSLIYSGIITLPYSLHIYLADCHRYDTGMREAADWCNSNLPGNARILVEDAGYIAYATKFRILDVAGLKTPEAIPINKEFTWPSGGEERGEAITTLASQDKGNYLINLREHIGLKKVPQQMEALGWKLELLKNVPVYSIYRITPPDSHAQRLPSSTR